ncbi:MAG: GNAT family N-acetyltransferase [Saprospiraceae bacterium]|nr:GNAT family N-acetyltransferase [Saprospiraceae bacterium]
MIKHYKDLTRDELYELLQFRQEVFVVEQNCPYLDADGDKDSASWHFWLTDGHGRMIAYCRVLPEGISYAGYAAIGRVISRSDQRGMGAGRKIMELAIRWIQETWPGVPIKISAQCYLDRFYQALGFVPTGENYLEDDIPHQAMVLKIKS